ncbi:MAG: hypothetical protein LC798_19070, partial [Chloroflexi bacterium]|nr:hypothetical protein [Chloroflexota bacterium]
GGVDLEKIAAAQTKLTEAQTDTAAAMAEVHDWQKKLAEAMKPADSRTKAKADRDLAAAQDEVTSAEIALRDAQADLTNTNKDGRLTADEYRAAQLRVRDAERDVAEAVDALSVQELEHGQVMIAGTTVTDAYKTATDGLTAAEERAKAAKDAETIAQGELTAAHAVSITYADDLAAAERTVEDAHRKVERAAWDAEKAQMAFNESVSAEKQAKVDAMASSVDNLNAALAALPSLAGAAASAGGGIWGSIGSKIGQPHIPEDAWGRPGGGASSGIWGSINNARAGATVNVTVNGDVLDPQNLWSKIHAGLLGLQRRSGPLGFS